MPASEGLENYREYILLAGATSDIGRVVAEILDSQNKLLILLGRDQFELDNLNLRLTGDHITLCHDLSNSTDIKIKLIDALSKCSGRVSKLLYMAGVDKFTPVKRTIVQEYEALMRVNFFSAVELTRVLADHRVNGKMLQDCVYISSISARRGYAGKAAYSASKAALEAFVRVAAVELAPEIAVNALALGSVRTKMFENNRAVNADTNYFERNYPLGEPALLNIAQTIVTTSDGKKHWMTGQTITIDGGRTA